MSSEVRQHAPESSRQQHTQSDSRSNAGPHGEVLTGIAALAALQRAIGNQAVNAQISKLQRNTALTALQRLAKPVVPAPTNAHKKKHPVRKLFNIVKALYKGAQPQIGDGSAADALRQEAQTGVVVGGGGNGFHNQKLEDIVHGLDAIINHRQSTPAMKVTARALKVDCQDALAKWNASPYA